MMKKKHKPAFEAVLVFQCPNCKKIETLEGFEDIFLNTGVQVNAEANVFYCGDCIDKDDWG